MDKVKVPAAVVAMVQAVPVPVQAADEAGQVAEEAPAAVWGRVAHPAVEWEDCPVGQAKHKKQYLGKPISSQP